MAPKEDSHYDDLVHQPHHVQRHSTLKLNMKSQAHVDRIHISGIERTKDDVILASTKELFKGENFEEVLVAADKVRNQLEALGCFSKIGVYLDVSKGSKATMNGLEVTYFVEEFRRMTGGVNTAVGNNTGSLTIGMRMPNMGGRGEKFEIEYNRGYHQSSSYSFSFSKPYPYKRYEPILRASLLQQVDEFPKSGYKQLDRGLLLELGFKTTLKAYHRLQWECLFRDTSALSRATSFAVREISGPTMKSAIRHILSIDARDEKIFPTRGNFVQLTSELSGLGGNMSFLKNDVHFQTNYSILKDIVLQGTLQTGLLNNFHGTNLTEHFYVGGPLSIRGFHSRGIGPQSEGSALGSNFLYNELASNASKFYWASGLHLYMPLPFKRSKGGFVDHFRSHFFINAGNIAPITNRYICYNQGQIFRAGCDDHFGVRDTKTALDAITKDIRLSSGFGVALKIGDIARFEVNYCIPLKYLNSDVIDPGFQMGLGVSFL